MGGEGGDGWGVVGIEEEKVEGKRFCVSLSRSTSARLHFSFPR